LFEPLTVASRTSGAENVLESSIWTSYVAELAAGFHENVIGCAAVSPFVGVDSVGCAGIAGGAGGVEVVAVMLIFVTNASPQKIEVSPLNTVSNAPVVAGKSIENVWPVTYGLDDVSSATSLPTSDCEPPRYVE